ncbi:Leucine-rich repeat transmembrane protein kinase, putative [Theobroma cacao]|uniref:non-specific serine/threonine protein kinase n=1 Tax=Theobroma cacao TaxID=3641 RepID=A0A061FG71_THECC|nr:Leucine-rich repeat transmembrane protein kinase, putative [Theobroma cacao]
MFGNHSMSTKFSYFLYDAFAIFVSSFSLRGNGGGEGGLGRASHFLHINCGGKQIPVSNTTYEGDSTEASPLRFFKGGNNWAFSSTGYFEDDAEQPNQQNDKLIIENTQLSMRDHELYTTARLSPISLTYYAFCLVNGTYNVSLHFAEIRFTGGQNFSSLGRRIFDVYIQGKQELKDFNIEDEAGGVGKPIIKNFTADVNDSTLEIRFYWAGKGTTSIPEKGVYGPLVSAISIFNPGYKPPPPPSENGGSSTVISAGVVVGIVAGAAFAIFLIGERIWYYDQDITSPFPFHHFGKECLASSTDLKGLELHTSSFALRQIKAATNNFDAANKIGEGGFGPVYKGTLADGTAIAVKQLSARSKQGNREFVTEIGMISALQHPNLVKLHGCCIEGNQLMLIYEYLENNSLARALFGPEEFQLKLDWRTRRKICIGIARGLAYLHEESRLKIVHRDIKATNVLLDKNLNPKISDFGLAKLDEEDNTHISTRIAGTMDREICLSTFSLSLEETFGSIEISRGYMAPEYALRGHLTDKADVYSFGIVALEIVSGRCNTQNRLKQESFYILDWAQILKEKGSLLDLVDPRIGSNCNIEEVMVMINVALLCTNQTAASRPSMSSVVSMLEGRDAVPEFVADSSISTDEFITAMKLYQQIEENETDNSRTMSGPLANVPSTSSTSAADLYPISLTSKFHSSFYHGSSDSTVMEVSTLLELGETRLSARISCITKNHLGPKSVNWQFSKLGYGILYLDAKCQLLSLALGSCKHPIVECQDLGVMIQPCTAKSRKLW